MKKLFTHILAITLLSTGSATLALADDGTSIYGIKLFESNTNAVTESNPTHRIPAIVTKGDTVIAFSDERYGTNGGDTGSGRIDVVCRVSTDNGKTWGEKMTVAQGSGSFAYGDPAVVCDRETGKILVMMASGTTSYSSSAAKNNSGTVNTSSALKLYKVTGQLKSDATIEWGTPTDMSSDIYGLYLYTTTSQGGGPGQGGRPGGGGSQTTTNYLIYVTKAFFGSGRICQSTLIKNGTNASFRLYAALTTNRGSLVIYSDDFGETWATLGSASDQPASGGDEAKVEELPNGDVLLVAKNLSSTGRYFNVYHWTEIVPTAAGSWGTAQLMDNTSTMPIARCNGEIYFVRATNVSTGKDCFVALLSAPASQSREKVSIWWKAINQKSDCDEISDWATASGWTQYQVSSTTSAYSTMRQQGDESIAFLYEENNSPHNNTEAYDIVYKNLTLSQITNGQYTGDDPWEGKIVTLKGRFDNNGTITEYYLHDVSDGGNTGGVKIATTKATDIADDAALDPSYYWVICKAPMNGSKYDPYYYLANFSGDGYMGMTTGTDYTTGQTVTNALGCTNDYTKEFHFRDFVTEGIREDGKGSANVEMSGVALNFFDLRDGQDHKNKYVSLGLNTSTDATELNWHNHTIKYENTNSDGKYWTTDFIMTPVERVNIIDNPEKKSYGTKDAPTEYGFEVTFTRHDNSYSLRKYEDYNYYATLKLPYAVSLPKNVKAYKVTQMKSVDDFEEYESGQQRDLLGLTELTLQPSKNVAMTNGISDGEYAKILPRETPVLLVMTNDDYYTNNKALSETPVTQTLYLNPEDAQLIQTTGFKGTLGKYTFVDGKDNDEVASSSYYLLSKNKGRVAFRYNTGTYVNHNKAYYVYTAGSSAKPLSFAFLDSDTATRIDRVISVDNTGSADADAPVYDLQGRRVSGMAQKGVYIKGGKKYLVK